MGNCNPKQSFVHKQLLPITFLQDLEVLKHSLKNLLKILKKRFIDKTDTVVSSVCLNFQRQILFNSGKIFNWKLATHFIQSLIYTPLSVTKKHFSNLKLSLQNYMKILGTTCTVICLVYLNLELRTTVSPVAKYLITDKKQISKQV